MHLRIQIHAHNRSKQHTSFNSVISVPSVYLSNDPWHISKLGVESRVKGRGWKITLKKSHMCMRTLNVFHQPYKQQQKNLLKVWLRLMRSVLIGSMLRSNSHRFIHRRQHWNKLIIASIFWRERKWSYLTRAKIKQWANAGSFCAQAKLNLRCLSVFSQCGFSL